MSAFPSRFLRNRNRRALALETLESRSLLAAVTVDFSDLTLGNESHWNGPDPNGVDEPGPFDTTVRVGKFASGGVDFVNRFNNDWFTWTGFAYSNETDTTTAGFGNQFSAFTGTGLGDAIYGVASGYLDEAGFDPGDIAQLAQLPYFTLPEGGSVSEVFVTNTTYPALSMLNGDSFAKKFGGESGDDPDWFKLTAYGSDESGNVLPGTAEIYLADYRFEDNLQDYVLDDWTRLDLSPLAGAHRVYFNVSSSDVGQFGLNTPGYFAIDDLSFTTPPNHAPVLDTSPNATLPPINEDAANPAGARIRTLVDTEATDADPAALKGIAIVAASHSNRGRWEFSLDNGASWNDLAPVSPASARLLDDGLGSRVRFVPNPNFNGVVRLVYRAWDQTDGTPPGGTVDLSLAASRGGETAFSTAAEQATLTITAVNDAPLLSGIGGSVEYARNTAAIQLASTAVVRDIDSPNFSGGKLLIRVTSGADASNRLVLGGKLFVVDASNNVIRKDATGGDKIIGTLNANGGIGMTRFEVTFTSQATAGFVQQLVRAMRFRTVNATSTAPRVVSFTVTDGPSRAGATASKTVNVT